MAFELRLLGQSGSYPVCSIWWADLDTIIGVQAESLLKLSKKGTWITVG